MFVVRVIDHTPIPSPEDGRPVKVSPFRGDLEGSSRLNMENDLTLPFSLRGNGAEDAGSGIKARPDNGSGVERGGGVSKRYHMSHAAGVANSIAWQFHPRGTHRVGLFSLDFLWFFLVSRQERTCKFLFAMFFCCDATIKCCSLAYALRASLYV
mgnify:CR=1 FL=1